MKLLLALVLLPLIEIALFIQVGSWLGLWPTLALVILSAVVGVSVMRRQGLNAMNDLRHAADTLDNPAVPVANGALILLGGVLLLIPGFFTDIFGIALLIPPVRRALVSALGRRVVVSGFTAGPLGDPRRAREPHRPNIVIDGEFEELDPTQQPPRGTSGWTRH